MAREYIPVELDNGAIVDSCSAKAKDVEKAAWTGEAPVYYVGWGEGKTVHKSFSHGFCLALAEKVPELQLGTYKGKPVFDTDKIQELVNAAVEKTYDIKVEHIRVAGNTSAKKEVEALKSSVKGMTAEQLEAIKSINPELAAILSKKMA